MLPQLRLVDRELMHVHPDAFEGPTDDGLGAGLLAQQRRLPNEIEQQGNRLFLQSQSRVDDSSFSR